MHRRDDEKLIVKALSDRWEFLYRYEDIDHLILDANQFPKYADALIAKVLNDSEEFKRLITASAVYVYVRDLPPLETPDRTGYYDMARQEYSISCVLVETAKQFPKHADLLISKVLNDPEEFKRLLISNIHFIAIAEYFHKHNMILIEKVLHNHDVFRLVIKSLDELIDTAKQFPKYADLLISKVLNDPKEFDRLIKNTDPQTFLVKQYSEDPKLSNLMRHSDIYKRVIKDEPNFYLREMAAIFPNQPILKAETLEKAFEMIIRRHKKQKNLAQVGIASSILGQGQRDAASPFSMFPKDILIKIAMNTAGEGVLTEEEANKKAHNSFTHPSNRTPKGQDNSKNVTISIDDRRCRIM